MTATTGPLRTGRALLLIDFQQDFLNAKGRMPVDLKQVPSVLAAAAKAMSQARDAGDEIIAIGNEFKPGDHLMNLLRRYASIAGSTGSQWTPALPLDGAQYFPKWAGSAFVNPELDPWLRDHGIHTLALTGLMAKACITATAKDAMKLGYNVTILFDAVACTSEGSRQRALERLQGEGATILRGLAA